MLHVAMGIFLVLIILVIVQAWLARGVVGMLGRRPPELLGDDQCPRVMVVLCLRGPDPYLADTLQAILSQDYPHYDLRIIVDSPNDPAWALAEQLVHDAGAANATIEPLLQRLETCGLKCSSLVQAVNTLDESHQVIALLDADTVPHPSWLRELVTPLANDQVAAATGNRWYIPEIKNPGSIIRYIWNVGAMGEMIYFGISWGGTLALKTSVFRDTELAEKWSQALVEDTMVYGVLRRHGLRVVFVPSLTMVNREQCNLSGFFSWVTRQLLCARLYHPHWFLVLAHAIPTSVALLVAVIALVVALWIGPALSAAWIIAGIVCYEIGMVGLVLPIEFAVQRIVRARGEPVQPLTVAHLLRLFYYIPITQAVYAAALTMTILARGTVWRGIRYRIDGPWAIRLLEYQPYPTKDNSPQSGTSL